MSTSYIFLASALLLFIVAIVILFVGKGKKDDKKLDKSFDENYAVNVNDVYLKTGDIRETLVQMQDSYEDYLEKQLLIWMGIMVIMRLPLI